MIDEERIKQFITMSKLELVQEIAKLEMRLNEEYRMTNELIGVLDENRIKHFYAKRDLDPSFVELVSRREPQTND